MKRILFAALAGIASIAAAPPKDWRLTTGVAPVTHGFTVGNPAAKVKLVEYLSFTCPHCGHFLAESKVPLHDTLVRKGQVAVETRSAARDPYDLAAWMVARCGGPSRFATLSTMIFAAQDAWAVKGSNYAQAHLAEIQAMPQLRQVRTLVDQSGLAAIAAKAGLSNAALNACFANDSQLKAILAMTDMAFTKIQGTPGFEVNGKLIEGSDWASVQTKLQAAGAK